MNRIHILLFTSLIAVHPRVSAQSAAVLPKDAEALKKSFMDARQRALQPLELKYKTELEKLLTAHTKAGHLNDALAIQAELDALAPQPNRIRQLRLWLCKVPKLNVFTKSWRDQYGALPIGTGRSSLLSRREKLPSPKVGIS